MYTPEEIEQIETIDSIRINAKPDNYVIFRLEKVVGEDIYSIPNEDIETQTVFTFKIAKDYFTDLTMTMMKFLSGP